MDTCGEINPPPTAVPFQQIPGYATSLPDQRIPEKPESESETLQNKKLNQISEEDARLMGWLKDNDDINTNYIHPSTISTILHTLKLNKGTLDTMKILTDRTACHNDYFRK